MFSNVKQIHKQKSVYCSDVCSLLQTVQMQIEKYPINLLTYLLRKHCISVVIAVLIPLPFAVLCGLRTSFAVFLEVLCGPLWSCVVFNSTDQLDRMFVVFLASPLLYTQCSTDILHKMEWRSKFKLILFSLFVQICHACSACKWLNIVNTVQELKLYKRIQSTVK